VGQIFQKLKILFETLLSSYTSDSCVDTMIYAHYLVIHSKIYHTNTLFNHYLFLICVCVQKMCVNLCVPLKIILSYTNINTKNDQ